MESATLSAGVSIALYIFILFIHPDHLVLVEFVVSGAIGALVGLLMAASYMDYCLPLFEAHALHNLAERELYFNFIHADQTELPRPPSNRILALFSLQAPRAEADEFKLRIFMLIERFELYCRYFGLPVNPAGAAGARLRSTIALTVVLGSAGMLFAMLASRRFIGGTPEFVPQSGWWLAGAAALVLAGMYVVSRIVLHFVRRVGVSRALVALVNEDTA